MLNDKLETVVATYAHLVDQNIAEEVYALIDRGNGRANNPLYTLIYLLTGCDFVNG